MHPQIRQPNAGLCPICAMDLIQLAPGGDGGLREIKVTPEAAALMDLRVSEVIREPAAVHVELFGRIGYDERNGKRNRAVDARRGCQTQYLGQSIRV